MRFVRSITLIIDKPYYQRYVLTIMLRHISGPMISISCKPNLYSPLLLIDFEIPKYY